MSITAVIYLRVSTEEQARRGFSLAEQREACLVKARTLATGAGEHSTHLDTAEFVDTVSGDLLERPALDRARAYVRSRRPHYFICLDPDRFSRATYQAILVANEIESCGTKLEFVQHDYQATPEGRLFFTLRVAIAEYEKAKIMERTARGRMGKVKNGGLPTGLHMYGYRYLKETEEVLPHPEEAPWVTQVFEWADREQLGPEQIAQRLNTVGVRTKRHTHWYRTTVAKMLRNRGYMGELQVNRWDFSGLGGQRGLPAHRRTVALTPRERPPEEWITVAIPPLITLTVWDSVQQRLHRSKRTTHRRTGLLSGMVTCGSCGAAMHYVPHESHGHVLRCVNRYPAYRCMKDPPPRCLAPHQAVRQFEAQVWEWVTRWLTDPGRVGLYLDNPLTLVANGTPGAPELENQVRLLEEQLGRKQREQARSLAILASGTVDPDIAAGQLQPFTIHIASIKTQIRQLRSQLEQSANQSVGPSGPLSTAGTDQDRFATAIAKIHIHLATLDGPARQTLVRTLVKQVLVHAHGPCEVEPIGYDDGHPWPARFGVESISVMMLPDTSV